jgi:hypothetical protein
MSKNSPSILIPKKGRQGENSSELEASLSPKAEFLPKNPADFFVVDQILTNKAKATKMDKKSIQKVTKEEKEKRKEEELRKSEEEKAKKKDEMKKKKEEKEARKLQEKMKSKDKKGKEPKSEGGPELSLSTEDSSLTEVSEDVAGEDQEWAEILNFNPNFDEDQTELDWGEASKAESFEEYARYMKETQYNVPASALIYDPFQSRILGSDIAHDFPPYTELPSSVVSMIFRYLDFQDILTIMRVCKQWREYTHDKSLWLDLYARTERKYWPVEETKNIWEELGTEDLQCAIQTALRNASSCYSPKRGGTKGTPRALEANDAGATNSNSTVVPPLRIQLMSSMDNANISKVSSSSVRHPSRRSNTPRASTDSEYHSESSGSHRATDNNSPNNKNRPPKSDSQKNATIASEKVTDPLSMSENVLTKSPSSSSRKGHSSGSRRRNNPTSGSQKSTSLKRSASVRARSNSITHTSDNEKDSPKRRTRAKNSVQDTGNGGKSKRNVRERSNSTVDASSVMNEPLSPTRERSATAIREVDTADSSPRRVTFITSPLILPPPPPPLTNISPPTSASHSNPHTTMARSKTLSAVDVAAAPMSSPRTPAEEQRPSDTQSQSPLQLATETPTRNDATEIRKNLLQSAPAKSPGLKHPRSASVLVASPPKQRDSAKSPPPHVDISQPPEKKNTHTSLNQLVASVTPYENLPDMVDLQTFIATYSTFTTTPALVRKLIQRFQVPKLGNTEEEMKIYQHQIERPIKLRVAKLLKVLIDTYYTEFSPQLKELLAIFIVGIADPEYGATLRKSMEKGAELVRSREAQTVKKETPHNDTTNKKSNITTEQILSFSAEEIAQQLTLIEFETYSNIKPAEFFNQAWAKATTWDRAPHIRQMIDRFNALTRWIATLIVSEDKIRMRVKRFVKFIKVADCLRKMHNYHTLMAVLSGLNEGSIYRLKHTRAEIPPRWAQTFQELQDLMKAEFSYRAYREELANAQPPCIPYIGIYLRDLTYFEEGGSNAEKGMINFKKNKNVYGVIQIIQKYQETPYTYKPIDKVYNYLKNPKGLDDATLLTLSLKVEPRNCKRNDLE